MEAVLIILPQSQIITLLHIHIVDASEVKKGTLEIDSDLPIHKYDKLGHNRYQVTFIAMRPGHHDLVIKYDGGNCTRSVIILVLSLIYNYTHIIAQVVIIIFKFHLKKSITKIIIINCGLFQAVLMKLK